MLNSNNNFAAGRLLMTINEINEYLINISQSGIILGLDTIKELLRRLGNPESGLKCIHVAGTNGKGSTIAYISAILREAGYKIGAYTSPCVFSEYEKYCISGVNISEIDYKALMNEVILRCKEMKADGFSQPTVFEIETAAAFYYFAKELCDYVVLETGMGGREDATNVIDNPEISVLTSIAMDHMRFLGNTIEDIAWQKGGIIKKNSKAVLYNQNEFVNRVISDICSENNSELILCDVKGALKSAYFDNNSKRLVFSYKQFEKLSTDMSGFYQAANASVAIETVLALRKNGADISDSAVREGVKKASLCGRFEKICDKPMIFIDGAHNPDAALKLAQTIKMYFTNRRLLYIMGVLADKDYDRVAELTIPLADKVFTITPDNVRALEASELAECVSKYCDCVEVKRSIKQAVLDAACWAEEDGVVIAFGSLSYIGAVREVVKEMLS